MRDAGNLCFLKLIYDESRSSTVANAQGKGIGPSQVSYGTSGHFGAMVEVKKKTGCSLRVALMAGLNWVKSRGED